ncbi:MAG: 6,7-dimethyl-8-ribityllumazine synthase [Pseudomonadota bacterium]
MPETDDHTTLPAPKLDPAPRVLIVIAPYYKRIAEAQLAGAQAQLRAVGATFDVVETPGALEIPPAIRFAAESGLYEGYVALGCVIRGETTHYETVCEESARGVTYLTTARGLAIGNGVLTVENDAQALERALPDRLDKGGGAAAACLHLIALARRFRRQGRPSPQSGSDDAILLA